MEVCGMMKYSTFTWDMVQALESKSLAFRKTPAPSIVSICKSNQSKRNKKS